MKSPRIYEDLSLIRRRSKFVFTLIKIIFLLLLVYFWKVQVIDHQKYWKKSEANRIRRLPISPQRGLVLDREGNILAKNIASFKVSIIREKCEDLQESCQRISQLLDMDVKKIEKRIEKFKSFQLFRPIVIKDNLSDKEVAVIESRKSDFPEILLQTESKRMYPLETLAAHVLGYLQEISPSELKSEKQKGYEIGDLIGKKGIEKEYEDLLSGEKGMALEVVDSEGRVIRQFNQKQSKNGENIRLTLDLDMQKQMEIILEGREGAGVVLNAKTGEVLAMASYPNFDPNKFITRFTPEQWMELIQDPDFPLENRAIRGLYSPGSLFKPLVAMGALDSNIISDRSSFVCQGTTYIYRHPFSCWYEPGHGRVNLYTGIKNSCNIYFYNVGKNLGIRRIADTARVFGFGSPTEIDLPGEKRGLVPDPEWKQTARGEPWYPGETIPVSIGQGPLLVTPLQVAVYISVIANRGKKVIPHLFLSGSFSEESGPREEKSVLTDIPRDFRHSDFEKVITGMWMAVNEQGTARAAQVKEFDVCGKTGSTQVVSSETERKMEERGKKIETHSWFTGFAPRNDPEVIVAIIIEYGGMGGSTAAPQAKKLFALYKDKYAR
ncbi:MAG: penicillin-binding protein 2 [Candidatus Aminicenantes bacterium]|nr:penicillin-binding protein 2 [Candidatus Aminicenantes bacterium]